MLRALPPLNGLRAFEAAARHLNFTRAAEELNVTQAAVSHQIKGLEERLGQPLFRRLNRKLLLTDAGQTLLAPMTEAFSIMTDAVARIEGDDATGALTITTLDSIASNWLVPRLGRFRESHPDIDVRITISDSLVDFSEGGVDVALRYGLGDYPGLHVVPMMTEDLFPVCSPALLESGPPLNAPEDLRHYTLFHDDVLEGWTEWFAAAGVTGGDFTHGPAFSHSNLVMRSAIAGEGVALGRSQLVADELASGRLVKPFEISVPSTWAYYIVSAPAHANRQKVKAFREWALEQANT
ncbi:MAG: transcriptional regulator GcvA [Rhodospirillales bacterium]|nr:transcriptional regulator GcvA [Alphaproteobacteria bacterium]MBL6948460.1 transcriptional regulator GcvA [Rhodospirillales bacterium]